MSGKGTIYSYEIVVQAIQPGFRDWAPYPVVLVELDEQRGEPSPDEAIRIIANLSTRTSRRRKRSTWPSACASSGLPGDRRRLGAAAVPPERRAARRARVAVSGDLTPPPWH